MRRHNFKELQVWNRAKDLVIRIYRLTKEFPKEELFGQTQQIRKSGISIPSNIAEGCGRGSDNQLVHFLDIAQGSAFEFETQLIIAWELAYLKEPDFVELGKEISEIQRMIDGFRNKFS